MYANMHRRRRTSMVWIAVLLLTLIAPLFAGQKVNAASLVNDSFDTYAPGAFVSGTSGWTTSTNTSTNQVNVATSTYMSPHQSIGLFDNSTSSSTTFTQTISPQTGNVVAQWDVNFSDLPTATTPNGFPSFRIRSSSGTSVVALTTGYDSATNSPALTYQYNLLSQTATVYTGLLTGEWYQIKVIANQASHTFDLYVNNELVTTGAPFSSTTQPDISSIAFISPSTYSYSAGNAFYIDDVSVHSVGAAPTGLSVTNVTDSSMKVNWSPVSGADGYYVYVSEYPDKDFNKMTPDTVTVTTYTNEDLFSDSQYYYRITAVTGGEESVLSSPVLGTTLTGNHKPEMFDRFIKGAAMDFAARDMGNGFVYKDENGVKTDPYTSLAQHGVNYVRQSVAMDPTNHDPWQGTKQTLAAATAVRTAQIATGSEINFYPDFMYSHCCADNSYQGRPTEWASDDLDQLKVDVFNYTFGVVRALKDQGTPVRVVQIGNELNGFLGYKNSDNYEVSELLKAGIAAAKAVDPHIRIIIHYGVPSNIVSFYQGLINNHVNFDVVGVSNYIEWGGTLSQLRNDMAKAAKLSAPKYFMLSETGYAWTPNNYDSTANNITATTPTESSFFPFSIEGQMNYLIEVMHEVAQKGGIGAEFWPTDVVSNLPDYGSKNDNAAFWDSGTGNLIRSMNAYETPVTVGSGVPYQSITNHLTSQALESVTSVTDGTEQVIAATSAGNESFGWFIQETSPGSGYYFIKNKRDYQSLRDRSTTSDPTLEEYDPAAYSFQWEMVDAGNGYVEFQNRYTGKYLRNASATSSSVTTEDLTSSWSFQWLIQ